MSHTQSTYIFSWNCSLKICLCGLLSTEIRRGEMVKSWFFWAPSYHPCIFISPRHLTKTEAVAWKNCLLSSVFKSLKQFFRLNQTSLPSKGNTLALYNLGKCHVSMGSCQLGEWTLDTAIKIKILKKEKKKPLTKVRSFLWHLLIQSWCFRCIAPPSTEALKRHGRVFSLRTCTRVQLLCSSFY